MKNLKKILCLVLALTVVLAFAGCDKEEDSQKADFKDETEEMVEEAADFKDEAEEMVEEALETIKKVDFEKKPFGDEDAKTENFKKDLEKFKDEYENLASDDSDDRDDEALKAMYEMIEFDYDIKETKIDGDKVIIEAELEAKDLSKPFEKLFWLNDSGEQEFIKYFNDAIKSGKVSEEEVSSSLTDRDGTKLFDVMCKIEGVDEMSETVTFTMVKEDDQVKFDEIDDLEDFFNVATGNMADVYMDMK